MQLFGVEISINALLDQWNEIKKSSLETMIAPGSIFSGDRQTFRGFLDDDFLAGGYIDGNAQPS